ncbi:hypothetical protein GF336_07095 [Candidatus Woesearchaeota archaeon]|nr:hypothetical protein [Candidatus Woesearchaeota archaeon]
MFTDIVFPDKNEKEFLEIAEKLGYKEIIFCYKNKVPELKVDTKIKVHTALISAPKNINRLSNKTHLLIVESSEKNRQVLENSKTDILFNLETLEKKDHMHFRKSGLNHILAELASKNNIIVGFSFSEILNSRFTDRAMTLGRIMQNIRLCRKYKVETCFASFTSDPYEMRAAKDLVSLLISLGISSNEAKSSLTSASKRIFSNTKKKSPEYIAEGIELVK